MMMAAPAPAAEAAAAPESTPEQTAAPAPQSQPQTQAAVEPAPKRRGPLTRSEENEIDNQVMP